MARILVLGATGYIGGRLVPRLILAGHPVRCLVRSPRKLAARHWPGVEIVEGDALRPEALWTAMKDIEVVYYLIHSLHAGEKRFAELDKKAAGNVAEAARVAGVKRIIYLGGLGKRGVEKSAHLKSRHEVGDILRSSGVPVTEFRAAVIIGSGGVSFEMMHHLVNRLPVMICPKWIFVKTQPISVRDVLHYLVECLHVPQSRERVIDIGGPDILSYGDMMKIIARVLGLKRRFIPIPLLSPRLSSYWINWVTPIPASIARTLIESLRSETICENEEAKQLFHFHLTPFEDSVRRSLGKISMHRVETKWTDAGLPFEKEEEEEIDPSHFLRDVRIHEAKVPAEKLFVLIQSIGGENGWYASDWLWRTRGFIDQQIGGVGLRRGRRHPVEIAVGDALDFWRVEDFVPNQRLLLRAEMKVPGEAWLEFLAEPHDDTHSRLTQIARFYPRGLAGLLYWYGLYPLHKLIFRGMAREIIRRAEK